MADADPQLLTVEEVARILRIGRDLAYQLAREGKIPVLRLGRRMVIPRQTLMRWIETEANPQKMSGPSVLSLVEDQDT